MDGPMEEGTDPIDEEHVPEDIFGPPVIDESACTPPNNNVGDEEEASPTPTRENRRYIQQNEARFVDGYDSEGYDGPFVPPFVEPLIVNDDDKIPTRATAPIVENTTAAAAEVTTDNIPTGTIEPIPDNVLRGMKLPQLKEELKLRNETVSGNKNVLRERLRAALSKPKFTEQELVLVRKAKKTDELRWQDSDAKQVLSVLLKNKNSWVNEIIDSDSTFSVPRSRSTSKTIAKIHGLNDSFRPFVITNFITNFKNLKLSIDTEAKNAAFDQISYEKEIRKYPIQEMLKCGYPRWNHPNNLATMKLLEEDTKPGGFYLKPKELKASRAEYNKFPDQIFRNRFFKAKTAHKEKPYWQNERNKSMRNKRVIEENQLQSNQF